MKRLVDLWYIIRNYRQAGHHLQTDLHIYSAFVMESRANLILDTLYDGNIYVATYITDILINETVIFIVSLGYLSTEGISRINQIAQ